MFFFLPWGVENAKVRLPVVSIGIFALCFMVFVVTWLMPRHPMGVDPQQMTELFDYFGERPYLQLQPEFRRTFLREGAEARLERLRESGRPRPDDESLVASEQRELDRMQGDAVRARTQSGMVRNALVPANGLWQRGLITHMFIHFGWGHLLFNMLFLYVVGLMLEDLWGRWLFGAFYLVGGLVAGLSHFALDPSSMSPMGGASGAVAACMGAFAVRFATRRVTFLYVLWLLRFSYGRVQIPAWIAGLAWFANELKNFVFDADQGTAVMAHLGGFAFGAATVLVMKVSGLDKRFASLSEQTEGEPLPSVHPAVEAGREALRFGSTAAARLQFEKALAADADDAEALLELVRLDFAEGRPDQAHQRLQRSLERLLKQQRGDQAAQQFLQVQAKVRPEALDPVFCFLLAQQLDPLSPEVAEPFYLRAATVPGLRGDKALLRAAELRLQRYDEPWLAGEYLARREVAAEFRARADELKARVPEKPAPPPASGLELDFDARGAAPVPPRIVPVTLVELLPDALKVRSATGDENVLGLNEVLVVAPSLVPVEGTAKVQLVVDLVVKLEPGSPVVALRLDSERSSRVVAQRFTGASAKDVYAGFLSWLLSKSNARALPSTESVERGEFNRRTDLAEHERETYAAL